MNLQKLSTWACPAVATAALAFACGPAWAQKGHSGGHSSSGSHHEGGGDHHGGDWHGGDNHGGSWGGYYGYGAYYPWGIGRALTGGWGGYGYRYGGYNGGYYNNYPYYDNGYYSTPSYNVPNYAAPAVNAPSASIPDNAALIDVRVPSNAQVWIDDQQTKQTGSMREFVTPSLDQGQEYSYDIKARWTENGQPMESHRKVTFHAGDRLSVNLMTAQNTAQPSTSTQTVQ